MSKYTSICYSFLLVFVCGWLPAMGQQYIPGDANSDITFKIVNHLVVKSTVTGHLEGIHGSIVFNPSNLQTAAFDVTVNVSTISTGIGKRDDDLQETKYFDAKKYPVIRIKSTRITKMAKNMYGFEGQLTMKGISRPISFLFAVTPANGGLTFKGGFKMRRMDYKVGPDNAIDNNLDVALTVFARKK